MRERRIHHEYFDAVDPEELDERQKDTWFVKYGEGIPGGVFVQEDLRFSRMIIASMLTEAWNEGKFYVHNAGLKPEPDEVDRLYLINYLQSIASLTGLLNGEEIRLIQERKGVVPLEDFRLEEISLRSFDESVELTKKWKEKGLTIGLFHGAFDPPTAAHLMFATESYTQYPECDKRIIGFENDLSLRNTKGAERPRYQLNWRRQVFGSFWMVDETVVLNAKSYYDMEAYVRDYRALNVDYVFLSAHQKEIRRRLKQISRAGAEPKYLYHLHDVPDQDVFHATKVLELLKKRGWI